MARRILVWRGTIPLPWPKGARADFGVFSEPIKNPLMIHGGTFTGTLRDNRQVIGYLWDVVSTQRGPTPKEWSLGFPLSGRISFREADKRLVRKIAGLFFIRRCEACLKPTRYEISFIARIPASHVGEPIEGDISYACLRHINEVIQAGREDGAEYWRIYRWNNRYEVGCHYYDDLGAVVYDHGKKSWVCPKEGAPDRPFDVGKVLEIELARNGMPMFTVKFDGGQLRVHHRALYEQLMQRFSPVMDEPVRLRKILGSVGISLKNIPADVHIFDIIDDSSDSWEECEEE